ncbi:Uncharacterized protein TCM_024532 [Theobroma cacao]|uniref:Gag-pro-like protein n=1 Tax=Theobroma cacao TaxID=3641 RepID=A0A061EWV9_THECC|nr:Uncharacterized protein TCM_024532 [Theobroma cacao]
MESEKAMRMDQMDKVQQEMKEQLAKMMELIMNISKGKTVVEELANQASQQTSSNNNSTYQPPGTTFGVNPVNPIKVPNLDDTREQEKLNKAPVHFNSLKPLYPKWYDANAHCDYHYGIQGHSTENCTAQKYSYIHLGKILNSSSE